MQQGGFPTTTRAGLIATAATGQQNVATLTGAPVAGPGLGGCLTQNGDFSNGLTGWTASGLVATADTTPADAPPGSATCVKLVSTGDQIFYQDIPCLPNTTYTLGGYFFGDGTNSIYLKATPVNASGGTTNVSFSGGSTAFTTAASWTFRTSSAFTTLGNTVKIRLAIEVTAASTLYAGRIGLVAGGTYADSQFSANPLGNLSLVACETTTNLLTDGDCEGVGGTATSVLFTDSFANAAAWTAVSGTGLTANQAAPSVAPVSTASGTTATVAPGSYITAYTWKTAAGETTRSPETTVTVATGQQVNVPVPAFPTNVTAAGVYITAAGGAGGTETYQGDVATSGGTFVLSAPPVAGTALPATNANANVAIVSAGSFGSAGHPDWWDTQDGGGTSSSQIRFQPQAGFVQIWFYMVYQDATHTVYAVCDGQGLYIYQNDNGTVTQLGGAGVVCTLPAGTSYWFVWSRTGSSITASVKADGSVPGAVLGTLTRTITATTFTYGKVAVRPVGTAALLLGQMGGTAYSGVCQVSGPRPTNWGPGVSAGTPAMCWSKAQSFSGTYSLSVYVNDINSRGFWNQAGIATVSGSVYTSSARIYVPSGTSPQVSVYGPPFTISVTNVGTTTSWQPLSETDTTNTTASQIIGHLHGGTGLAYFDGFGYEQKAYPTLNLDPFPAFYVPTGARAAACVTVPTPATMVGNPKAPWTIALTVRPTVLSWGAASPALIQDSNISFEVYQTTTLLQARSSNAPVNQFTVLASPVLSTPYCIVLAYDGAGTMVKWCNGVLVATSTGYNPNLGSTLQIAAGSTGEPNPSISGLIVANHAWSAAEVAADFANANPPGLIVGGGQYLQPGMLYAQTPDATGNSLALPPPTGGRVVQDVAHVGVVRAGSLQPLTGQSTVGVQGAVFDAAGLLQAGGLKHIGATVGTSQVAVAHGLGRVPSIILFFERSNATSWQSATADATNVYLTASVAGTSVDLYVA